MVRIVGANEKTTKGTQPSGYGAAPPPPLLDSRAANFRGGKLEYTPLRLPPPPPPAPERFVKLKNKTKNKVST